MSHVHIMYIPSNSLLPFHSKTMLLFKNFIIQIMHQYIICRYNKIIKYLKKK